MRFGEGPQVRAPQRGSCKFDIILHEEGSLLAYVSYTRPAPASCRQRPLAYTPLATSLSLSLSATGRPLHSSQQLLALRHEYQVALPMGETPALETAGRRSVYVRPRGWLTQQPPCFSGLALGTDSRSSSSSGGDTDSHLHMRRHQN